MVRVGGSHFYQSGLARALKAREEILEVEFPVSKARWAWWVALSKVRVVGAPFRVGAGWGGGAGVFSHRKHEENRKYERWSRGYGRTENLFGGERWRSKETCGKQGEMTARHFVGGGGAVREENR